MHAAPDTVIGDHVHPHGLRTRDQIIKETVHEVLLIDPDIPVAQEVVLQRTQFDAHLRGGVVDADRGEIGKP